MAIQRWQYCQLCVLVKNSNHTDYLNRYAFICNLKTITEWIALINEHEQQQLESNNATWFKQNGI